MVKEIFRNAFRKLPGGIQENVRKNIFEKIKNFNQKSFYKSYSQCGEDLIAQLYLSKLNGVYVDVGAFHPEKISNTHLFFKKGWHGINVDGTKQVIELFNKHRPNDKNIHAVVGLNNYKEITFYKFKSGALNTFKKEQLDGIKKYHGEEPVEEVKLPMRTLESILDENMIGSNEIDLLNVDAEGADEEVLLSNNWKKYKPKVIIVENHASLPDFLSSNINKLLSGYGYAMGGFSRHSFIFYIPSY